MLSEILDCIRDGTKLLLHNFWDFLKKVGCFCFLYGQIEIIPVLFSLGLMLLLKLFDASTDTCSLIFKITLIFGQLIPAAGYAGMIHKDKSIEGSIDVAFCGTIICALLIWYAL